MTSDATLYGSDSLDPGVLSSSRSKKRGGGEGEELGTRLGSWAFYDLNFLRSALINPARLFRYF